VARVPVIVLSAAHNLQGAAENLAAAAIFSKPFDLGTLLDAVGRLVGSSCRFQPK
jgi:DNA-binding response OmpR family regulator